jgi:hypothetical protein
VVNEREISCWKMMFPLHLNQQTQLLVRH